MYIDGLLQEEETSKTRNKSDVIDDHLTSYSY